MIRLLFFLLLFISVSITSAQDIILKQNGEKLKVELIKVSADTVYYKNFGIRNTIIKQLNFSEVLRIYYANKTNLHDKNNNNTNGPLDKSISRKTKDSNKVNAEEKDQEEPITSSLKVNSPRVGYIGIATGTAIPIGEFANEGLAKTGITNAINFGCRLSEKMGIAALWFSSSNPIDISNYGSDRYRGLLIGPSISLMNTKKMELDVRAMVGYSMSTLPEYKIYNQLILPESKASSAAYSIGSMVRYNKSDHIAFTLSADYFTSNPEFTELGENYSISNISIGVGIAYRLK